MKWLCVAFLLTLSTLALAGPMSDALPRLTEGSIARVLPVMRMEAEQADAGLAAIEEMTARVDEYTQLIEDIRVGKVDPLAWLRSQSKYLIAPPSAKYEQELSRWVSSSYLFDPVALFSFGIDAPEAVTNATRDGEKGASFILSGQDLSGVSGGKEFEAVIDGVKKFYRANKFKDAGVQYFFTYSTMSPDSSVDVFLHSVNMFAETPASEGVPDGPLLWLSHSSANISAEAISKSEVEADQAASNVEAALARAGMTYDVYKGYLGSLAMAKTDAVDPSSLDITLDASGLSADQAEAVKDMRDFYALRKSNLKVYKKMEAQVKPLLERMGL